MKNEFHRFLKEIYSSCTKPNVAKMANLVEKHFDEIAPLVTQRGQRIKKIVELACKEWGALPDVIQIPDSLEEQSTQTIQRITSLKVGPFRGFAREEEFILDSPVTLIYGPNGTGKTSFCEALEYSLLGTVEESTAKRISIDAYLKNIHTSSFSPPILKASDSSGNNIVIHPNEEQYRFCFIEKNRIDQFSRMAAFTPKKQSELIATLFGLDAFSAFVKDFSDEIKSEYIDTYGTEKLKLEQKSRTIEISQKQLEETQNALNEQSENERAVAIRYRSDISYSDFIIALGTTESPGEIQQLEIELRAPRPTKIGISSTEPTELKRSIEQNHNQIDTLRKELHSKSESVAYKSIYKAIKTLGETSREVCPACKTPLSSTKENPYTLAIQELGKLNDLDDLQTKLKRVDDAESEYLRTFAEIYQKLRSFAINRNEELLLVSEPPFTPTWSWCDSIFTCSGDDSTLWEKLQGISVKVESNDLLIDANTQSLAAKNERLKFLQILQSEYLQLEGSRKILEQTMLKVQTDITSFEQENIPLLAAVENEKLIVVKNIDICEGYAEFVRLLLHYNDSLPSKLVADLSEQVVTLYNAFNRYDNQLDQLLEIKLPMKSEERIMVKLNCSKDRFRDALHILSEGHLRCVGLSILLAKNLKENAPFIIFDDPVNAIDTEHREAIRHTLFKDSIFDCKQIILTSHGEEFYKDIQNTVPKAIANQFNLYSFLPKTDDNHIVVNSDKFPRNFVAQAEECISRMALRDALMSSRRGIEAINIRLWEYYRKNGGGALSVSMRRHNQPWDTRALAEQLKCKIGKDDFTAENKDAIMEHLGKLLGNSGQSKEWNYLNKGTHEESDRDEFDISAVQEIVNALIQLDNLV